jgi:hypothetical protein
MYMTYGQLALICLKWGLTSEATPANAGLTFMLLAPLRCHAGFSQEGIGRLILNLDLRISGRYAKEYPIYTFFTLK